jgi:hypothetical protein
MAWPLTRRACWLDHTGELPVIEGTLLRLQVQHLPGDRNPKPVWLWSSITNASAHDVDRWWQGRAADATGNDECPRLRTYVRLVRRLNRPVWDAGPDLSAAHRPTAADSLRRASAAGTAVEGLGRRLLA